MAEYREEPPPMNDNDDNDADKSDKEDDELFSSALDSKPGPLDTSADKDMFAGPLDTSADKDIFSEATEELSLDSPQTKEANDVNHGKDDVASGPAAEPVDNHSHESSSDEPPKLNVFESAVSPPIPKSKSVPEVNHGAKQHLGAKPKETSQQSRYNIQILVKEPKKVGDGMNAYMTYKVVTKTNIPDFRKSEMEVYRRFSDFLGLHEKLVEKHLHRGCIIPPPPEKSVIGMTKIKISKEEAGSAAFVEHRRAALERFVNGIAKHPDLQSDPSFVDFLEVDSDLPRATSTSALSGAGVLRLFSRVGDSLGKMTYKMDEADAWFEEKQQEIETLDMQLKKLYASVDTLVGNRKELAQGTGLLANSIAMLGSSEEHTALARVLGQLAEVEERCDNVHVDQSYADFFVFAELVHEYVGLVQAVKEVFHERVKAYKAWKDEEVALNKKREAKAKLELAHKTDKVSAITHEITELEHRVEKAQEEFDVISKSIRKEVERFELQRYHDFKAAIISYLESVMNNQQQLVKYWEAFIPEAKAIV